MKLKRMESKEIQIDEYQFRVRPFPAMYSAYIFGDVVSLVAPILGTVALSTKDKDALSFNFQDYAVDLDVDSVANALSRLDGKQITGLMSELLLQHGNVSLNDEGVWRPMKAEDFDEIFCMFLGGAFKLCAEVVVLNYGNFFRDLGRLFGNAMKKFVANPSKSSGGSTENN